VILSPKSAVLEDSVDVFHAVQEPSQASGSDHPPDCTKLEKGCPSVECHLWLVHVLWDCTLFLEAVFDDLGIHVAIEALHSSLPFVGSASGPRAEQGSFGKDEAGQTADVPGIFRHEAAG
jgi:hypothetical protein